MVKPDGAVVAAKSKLPSSPHPPPLAPTHPRQLPRMLRSTALRVARPALARSYAAQAQVAPVALNNVSLLPPSPRSSPAATTAPWTPDQVPRLTMLPLTTTLSIHSTAPPA